MQVFQERRQYACRSEGCWGFFFLLCLIKKISTLKSTVLLEYLCLYTARRHPQMFQQSHIHHVDVVIIEANTYKNECPWRQKRGRVLFSTVPLLTRC